MLIFSQFYEQREWCAEQGLRAAILQMKTGEGKSIVIAMMAIYTVRVRGRVWGRVRVRVRVGVGLAR